MMICEFIVSSRTLMTERIDVSFSVVMNWLMIGGIMILMACGSTTFCSVLK